jgi:hypothetical protein
MPDIADLQSRKRSMVRLADDAHARGMFGIEGMYRWAAVGIGIEILRALSAEIKNQRQRI